MVVTVPEVGDDWVIVTAVTDKENVQAPVSLLESVSVPATWYVPTGRVLCVVIAPLGLTIKFAFGTVTT